MISWINKKPAYLRQGQKVLLDLSTTLELDYQMVVDELTHAHGKPTQIKSLQSALMEIATIGYKIKQLIRQLDEKNFSTICKHLETISKELTLELSQLPQDLHAGRRHLTQTLHQLVKAEEAFNGISHRVPYIEREPDAIRVLVPTDLLYHSFQSLFPAERMLVITGRKDNNRIILGVGFDVTGRNTAGHVQADPDKLAQALIAMTSSDTHLAAWLHSHPGTGPIGTHPSSIDLNQHQDWLKDYSQNLISAIFVKDRYVRFWGKAVETGRVHLKFVGDGVRKENQDEPIYRLDPQ